MHVCKECGYGIYSGDKYADIDGDYYCEDCLDTEIRIYQLEDRMNVAAILVKNGYTVSQVKRSNGDGKNVQYRLKLEESEDNIRVVR